MRNVEIFFEKLQGLRFGDLLLNSSSEGSGISNFQNTRDRRVPEIWENCCAICPICLRPGDLLLRRSPGNESHAGRLNGGGRHGSGGQRVQQSRQCLSSCHTRYLRPQFQPISSVSSSYSAKEYCVNVPRKTMTNETDQISAYHKNKTTSTNSLIFTISFNQ